MTKTVYHITSLHTGKPSYRVYIYTQALDLLLAVRKQWGDIFWIEQQEREVSK